MREIKFRAWHKGTMVYGITVSSGGCDNWNHNEHIIMQYTGLKDQEGKEIYEGDIVLYSVIVASSDQLKTGLKEYAEFKWNDKNKRIDLYVHSETKDNYFEELDETISELVVIGNIYHTPEKIRGE